eukprot:1506281-Amphidinium_carterae.2
MARAPIAVCSSPGRTTSTREHPPSENCFVKVVGPRSLLFHDVEAVAEGLGLRSTIRRSSCNFYHSSIQLESETLRCKHWLTRAQECYH